MEGNNPQKDLDKDPIYARISRVILSENDPGLYCENRLESITQTETLMESPEKEVLTETPRSSQKSSAKKIDQKSEEPSLLGRLKPFIKLAIVAVVLVFLALTIRKAYIDVMEHREHLDFSSMDWRWLLLGVMAYVIGMMPAAIAWLQTLRAFGETVPLWVGLHAYFLGHLGKYVPGKAMVIVLRVGRLAPHGIGIKPTIVSIFVETLTSVAVGAILGCVLLFFAPQFPPTWMVTCAAICIPCSLVFLLPHTFRFVLTFLAKSKIGRMPRSVGDAFTWRLMMRTCAWMVLGWILHGTAGWLVLSGIQSTPELWTFQAWAVCVSAVSLGAVAGFASMLPGGAVIRELVITWLLSSIVPQPIALFAAIAFRIANLIAEFLVVGVVSTVKGKTPGR